MDYISQLKTNNWKIKRETIIKRDDKKCKICHNESYINNNKFGVFERKNDTFIIWDYESMYMGTGYLLNCSTAEINTNINGHICFYEMVGHQTIINAVCDEIVKFKTQKEITLFWAEITTNALFSLDYLDDNLNANYSQLFIDPINKKQLLQKLTSLQWQYCRYLNVHHKYYTKGKLAWEYPDEALITLCWDCHENLHKNESIPFIDENGKEIGKLTPCQRCFGAGYFPEYNHVQNGVCFECNGVKYKDFM